MKNNIIKRTMSLILALICVLGLLPLSAFAATGLSSAPDSITQKSSDYMYIGGRPVRYRAASDTINNNGLPYVFDEQVMVPGLDAPTRALCAYQKGTLGNGANGQKWNFKTEVTDPSLKTLLTYVYAHTYGNFTDAGNARGLDHWTEYWSDIWFMVAQAMSWYYEYGIIIDVTANREGFIEQVAEEFVSAMKLYHRTYGQSSWIKDWDAIDTHSIIDSSDGGKTGYSAYDYIKTGVDLVLDHPEYYHKYRLWEYEWDKSQPWKLPGQSGVPMQRLLIAVPQEGQKDLTVQMTVKKLEAGTNKPMAGVTFKVESADGSGSFSATKITGADGTFTLTQEADNLKAGQQTGEPLSGVLFRVAEVNGGYDEQHFTNAEGLIVLEGLNPGAYTVQELKPKNGWVEDDTVHTIYLEENKTTTIELSNLRKPDLFIKKVDSITGSPIKGVKFQVWRGSNDTKTGEYNDLGVFYTDPQGEIHLERQETGWYKIQELEPAPGYTIKEPAIQEIYLAAGKDHTVTFENTPKNAIVVEKYDSVTHQALPGCTFQLRYLGGASGTGGTVIGQKVTGNNGIAMWTGLNPGSYIVEEIDPADGYNIINASETVFLADDGEQSVVTVRFNNSPNGSLLIRKVCATNPSVTLQNAEFKVTYSDGTLIGDSNGIFRSDENGEVLINDLKPGSSVIVTEVRAPAGFLIDTQSVTVQIKEGRTMSVVMKNQPRGKLIIQKRDSQTNEVLPGAEFRITTAAGCEVGLNGVIGTSTLTQNGIFRTDSQGEIRITNLAPGAYVLTEIKAPDGGCVIDTPSTNVVIGQGGDTQTVIIKNTRKGGLIVEKYDKVTKQPLAGAQFKIMMANGELTPDNEGLTSSNGLYTTGQNGQIVLSKLLPGTYVVSEERAPDNYRKDSTPQTVVVNAGDVQTVRFYDDPLCTLTILKRDAVTKKPLKGAEFLVKDSSGQVIGPNNGLYTTGTDGTVTVTGLAPDSTIVVSEKRAPMGYILDETPKNIVVRSGVANSLIFDDEPGTTLIIHKYIEGTENEPLSGVAFKVVDGSGAAVGPDDGIYYTDKAGEIVLEGIEPGTTVIAREIKSVEGYVLDGTPQDIKIVGGRVQNLTFWNKKAGTLVIQKKDKVSGALISGAQFQLTYANGGYVDNDNGHLSSNGLYTTDDKGEIRITGITGTVVVKETKPAPGYVIDQSTQTQTVTVNALDTQTLTFLNEPLCSLTLTKLDSVTGKRGFMG